VPDELAVGGCDPGSQPLPASVGLLRLLRVLAGQEAELPAGVLPAQPAHQEAGLGGVEDQRQVRHAGDLCLRVVRPVIDDERFGLVAQLYPVDAGGLADEAIGPVGTDDVAGPDGPGQPRVTLLDRQLDVVLVLVEVDRFPALVQFHGRLGAHRPVECVLQVGLVDQRAQVPSRLAFVVPVEMGKRLACRVEEVKAPGRVGAGLELAGDLERLQDAHDLVVHAADARQPVEPGLALEHRYPVPAAPEQRGHRLADRAVADLHDIEGFHANETATGTRFVSSPAPVKTTERLAARDNPSAAVLTVPVRIGTTVTG